MPKDTQHPRGIAYLTVITCCMIAFGAAMVLSPVVSRVLFNWMIFGETGTPADFSERAADFTTFSHGVMGTVMVGWFLLVLWLVRRPLADGLDGTWSALALSLGGWYAIDTTYSLIEGYWPNAVLNTITLAAFAPGLWLTRPPAVVQGRPEEPLTHTTREIRP